MIQIPKLQFRLRTVMLIVAAVAFWLASLHSQYLAARVPRYALLLVLLAALNSAVYCHGPKRAFWLGFFMLGAIHALRPEGLFPSDETDWLFNSVLIHIGRLDKAIYVNGLIQMSRALVAVIWGVLGAVVSLAIYLRWHEKE